jgi:Family of unknown function (DUF6452)
MIRTVKYILLVAVVACWAACKQDRQICLTPKIAILNVETMHIPIPGAAFADTAPPSPTFVGLTASAEEISNYNRQSSFTLSLSPLVDTAQWLFRTDTASAIVFDTLTFHYTRLLKFLSNACGYTYFYNLNYITTTHNIIDSVHITNTSVTNNANTKHLQIYIHPDY